jgi:hypothetical protein
MTERGVLVLEDIQAGLEPKLRPNLTPAQRLLVVYQLTSLSD